MEIKVMILFGVLVVQAISLCQCGNVSNGSVKQMTDSGIWSQLLEDYTLSKSKSSRTGRAWDEPINVHMNAGSINGMNSHMNVNSNVQQGSNFQNRYLRPQGFYITKRIGEAMELEPHMRPPAKVINPPFRQNFGSQPIHSSGGHTMQVNSQHQSTPQQLREVSETDLYLLGAIEKLVYRVDYLESRVRRSEQMIYYLMAGNNQNQKEVKDSCPANFTRVGDNCYHINDDKQVNWKTANSACKSMGAILAEFEKVSENEELIAYLLNHQGHRGKDFWLGGLNPGLLWIWANSAKPVNPNTNLTSIAQTAQNTNTNATSNTNTDAPKAKDETDANQILNNTIEIKGSGRCLRLSYNPAKHSYFYYGQECTSRHHYMCEYEDKSLDNKIKKIARDLNLDF